MYRNAILVVDDDPNILTVMEMVFSCLGIDVKLASSGEDAIELMNEEPTSIVILDVEMPKMDGIKACQKIREISPSSIIVMVTGKILTDGELNVIFKHANAYFSKPVDIETFLSRLQVLMRDHYYCKMHGDGSRAKTSFHPFKERKKRFYRRYD